MNLYNEIDDEEDAAPGPLLTAIGIGVGLALLVGAVGVVLSGVV